MFLSCHDLSVSSAKSQNMSDDISTLEQLSVTKVADEITKENNIRMCGFVQLWKDPEQRKQPVG